ncbi:unnamed protein product [Oppiella nova]|uniref:RING-type E3 ubiquitin transferase n=1 Tax=Oppiella nova TaxID=334625 RepID=A0A7R9LEH2_9ACAR|nr:unnamed protein product [Oppiella nova]CAG2162852.1 unnamed protein product [Oppiella nova]
MSKVNTAKIANLSMVKQVECAVCMDVYTDPVVTECGHTFCRHCISLCMDSNPVCPQCRKDFITRKLTVNFSIKSIIETGLEFRCDYDWNGCKELLSLDQLPGHHRECRFRYCGKCRANVSRTGRDHKCKGLSKPAVNTNVNSVNTDQDHKGEGQSTVVGNHSKSETTGARKHIPRRCRYWPTCRKGDQCNFHHPDQCCFQYAKSGSCRFVYN